MLTSNDVVTVCFPHGAKNNVTQCVGVIELIYQWHAVLYETKT